MTPHAACLDALEVLCARFRIDSLRPQLLAGRDMLRDDGMVDVAVLGQFKAGKSSFLNSLLGREIMPVGVLPATAVVTRVRYGPTERVVVRHQSGSTVEIPAERLPEFVTEQGNPGNARQVAIVDVELASLEPFRGIRFVDTPGLGSVFAHNTQVSMDWLPRVGGALVAVSINHPLSEQDLKLLGEVFRHTPEVSILLTKADLVPDGQVDVVVEFTRRQVAHRTGKELLLFPYSIRPGYDSLRSEVREHLLRHIGGQREAKFAEIVDHKLRSLLAGCREYLLLAQGAAAAAVKAREELQEVLRRERGEIGSVSNEIRIFALDLASQVRTAAGERFDTYRGEVAKTLRTSLRERSAGWTGNLAKTTRAYEEWLGQAVVEEMARLSDRGDGHLAGFLFKAQQSLTRTVRAFQDRLAKEIERSLGITFAGAGFHAQATRPARPDIRLGQVFDTHIDLLWFLVPMDLVRPIVFRHFRRRIPWEVEKNLSRLAGQWADAVNSSIEELVREAMAFMQNELSTVEGLVANAFDRRIVIRDALDELALLESSLPVPR